MSRPKATMLIAALVALLSVLLPAALMGDAAAEQPVSPTLRMQADRGVEAGDAVIVEIGAELGVESLAVAMLEVTWDPAALSLVSCDANGLIGVCNEYELGGLLIGTVADAPWTDGVTLSVLEFTALADGAHGIDVSAIQSSTDAAGGGMVDVAIENATATVTVGDAHGTIAGLISGSSQSMMGIEICATPAEGGEPECATTDGDGNYVLGLLAGDYDLTIVDPAGLFAELSGAAEVGVGELTTFDAALEIGEPADRGKPDDFSLPSVAAPEAVTGLEGVAKAGDRAAWGVEICAVEVVSLERTCVHAGINGDWSIDGLEPGTYKIEVSDPAGRFNGGSGQIVRVNAGQQRSVAVEMAG